MSAPLLHLPGQAFTIWTRPPGRVVRTAPKPAATGAKISLPGKQFTIWTRSVTKPQRSAPAVAAISAKPPEDSTASKTWLSRAAWLAVPFLGALWYSDHQSQNNRAEELTKNHLMDQERKIEFQNQSSSLSLERSHLASQLDAAESKQRELNLGMGRLKAVLAETKESLMSKNMEAQAASEKVKALKQELAAVKSGFGEKESAWNNSLAVLKADASKARQTLEQRELDMKDQIAKVEAERAASQKDAAAAAAKATEMAAQIEALQKKSTVAPVNQ